MNDRMQTIADLSFNPSSDFELFALESAIDEAMADYHSTCEAYGRYEYSSSMESMFFGIGLECDEADYEDDDEADEAIEASLREVGHSIMEWWRAVKSKFIMFCRKVSSTVTNAMRKVQATFATRNLNANDNITIGSETLKKILIADVAMKKIKEMKAPLSSALDRVIKRAKSTESEETEEDMRKAFRSASLFSDGTEEKYVNAKVGNKVLGTTKIKGSRLRELAKDISNSIKDSQDITTLIDRKLNDALRSEGFSGRYVSIVRSMVGEIMQAMTNALRAGFNALMETAKQATKKKYEDERRPKKEPKTREIDLS